MKATKLGLGIILIEPTVFNDNRGYFFESFSLKTLREIGITADFIQDNHLYSHKKGTLRGIHFQNSPKAQAKLVRCTRGKILDVAVDLRKDSLTYKQWVSAILTSENFKQLFIPKGFGHGCISLTSCTEVQYKVDELYAPQYDRTILWNDSELDIDWGTNDVIVSDKDVRAPILSESDVNFI